MIKLLSIKVIPNAKKNEITQEGMRFKVRVTSPAIDGKANKAAIEALADFLKVKKNAIRIIKGERSREKLIEVNM